MNNPKVIISVLNWNNFQDTLRCLSFLKELNYDNYEITVVDNNSTNNSVVEIRNIFPEINLIRSPGNNGYAGGHALAVEYAIEQDAELIWILNNDITVRKDSLLNLVKAYARKKNAIYGSITLSSENPDIIEFGGGLSISSSEEFDYNRFKGIFLTEYFNKTDEREVQSVEGSSVLIPVKIIKSYGFMGTFYFMYGEDTDYCYYLRTKGISSIIVPSSVIIHKGAASFEYNEKLSFISDYYRRRNYLLFRKNFYNWSNKKIIFKQGGTIPLLKFFIKYLFFSNKKFRIKNKNLYFINLATIHAILGIKGKTIKPEKSLSVTDQNKC